MKKAIITVALLLFPFFASAQSVEISAREYQRTNSVVVTCAWVADAAGDVSFDIDETIDTVVSENGIGLASRILGTYCGEAVTIPDPVTAPTADYDIAVVDGDGLSIFGTALDDRSATLAESTAPQFVTPEGNIYGGRIVRSTSGASFQTYSITISGAGDGGKGVLRLVFR